MEFHLRRERKRAGFGWGELFLPGGYGGSEGGKETKEREGEKKDRLEEEFVRLVGKHMP